MSYTDLCELLAWLRTQDEVTLLELLEVSSDNLVDSFIDRIIENQEKFNRLYVENK